MPRSAASTRGLRLDLLGGEDAGHRREERVAVHQLEVAGQLLDAVDVAAALDLDRDRAAAGVAAQDVDRTDRGHVLAPDEPVALAQRADVLGQQPLQVGLDAVLDQAGVHAELMGRVVQGLLDRDDELLAGLVRHRPGAAALLAGPSRSVQGGLIQFSGL